MYLVEMYGNALTIHIWTLGQREQRAWLEDPTRECTLVARAA